MEDRDLRPVGLPVPADPGLEVGLSISESRLGRPPGVFVEIKFLYADRGLQRGVAFTRQYVPVIHRV